MPLMLGIALIVCAVILFLIGLSMRHEQHKQGAPIRRESARRAKAQDPSAAQIERLKRDKAFWEVTAMYEYSQRNSGGHHGH